MMARVQDDRIPVRFAAAAQAGAAQAEGAQAGAGEALLIEEGLVEDATGGPEGRAVARFRPGGPAHLPGCACCIGRGAAATALGDLFQARALGRVAWFTGVVAVVADPAAVAAELESDRLAAARFRVRR